MRSQFKYLVLPGLALALFGTLLWVGYPQRVQDLHRNYRIAEAPPMAQISPPFIGVLTLGHKNIYDDFINIWLLQSLLDTRKAADPEELMSSIRSVIRHVPRLESIYLLSCFTMYLDYKKPEYCQEIILAGLKAFPESWRLPMTQAYVHYFLLKEPAQAASFFMMAASRPQSPDYVKRLVKKLLAENELNAEDVKRSMEIMAGDKSGGPFLRMLEEFGKLSNERGSP